MKIIQKYPFPLNSSYRLVLNINHNFLTIIVGGINGLKLKKIQNNSKSRCTLRKGKHSLKSHFIPFWNCNHKGMAELWIQTKSVYNSRPLILFYTYRLLWCVQCTCINIGLCQDYTPKVICLTSNYGNPIIIKVLIFVNC